MKPTVDHALNKIHSFQRFGSVLGLERMTELLGLLGNPQEDLKVIHVAGTNGKGSTCRYIYCVLKEAGYKVGLYTSPFLEVFNERIEVDGHYISDEDLAIYTERVLEKVKEITDAGHASPTEFEVVTAIAFLYYKEQNCDYVVLEVGLGGTGDSTNVVKNPLVSVITSISLDHMDRLGSTIEAIAKEKAGIIKSGCPVVTSCVDKQALSVLKQVAEERNCSYYETDQIPFVVEDASLSGSCFSVDYENIFPTGTGEGKYMWRGMEISMNGLHQVKNAMGAMVTLELLRKNGEIHLTETQLRKGLKEACQIGRFEVLSEEPLVIIDGAHNEDGARVLSESVHKLIAHEERESKPILMVTGILADKDVEKVLEYFTAITKEFMVTEPENPRKMDAETLARQITNLGGICQVEPSVPMACQKALKQLSEGRYGAVVFAGSLYMIGQVRTILNETLKKGDVQDEI